MSIKNQTNLTPSPLVEKVGARGFTIVELLIVIVILAVLATISFISFNGYSSTSRDSSRVTDVSNLTTGLNMYANNSGIYPMPEGTVSSGTINGKEVAYKGEIRDNISRIAGISKTPVDPLTKGYYSYGVSFNGKYFQIGVTLEDSNSVSYNDSSLSSSSFGAEGNGVEGIYENNSSSLLSNVFNGLKDLSISLRYTQDDDNGSLINQTYSTNNIYADSSPSNNYSTKVSGNYLGIIKFSTGAYTYLSNIPSLIFNFSGNTNPSSNLLTGSLTYYIIDKNNNYPYKLVDSMNINNKDGNTILQTLTNNSGATLTGVDISSIVNSTGTVASIFSGSVLSSFGYGVDVIGNVVGGSNINSSLSVIENGTCGTSNGQTLASLPSTNLCSVGTSSTVLYNTGAGTYNWTCGSSTSCKAYDNYSVLLLHFDGNLNNSGTNISTINNIGGVTLNSVSTGSFGNAAYFNGSNSYLSMLDSTDWNLGNNNYTIDFLVKPIGATVTLFWYGKNTWNAAGNIGYGIYRRDPDIFAFQSYDSSAAFISMGTDASPLPVGSWSHIAIVRNGTTAKIYVNGTEIISDTSANGTHNSDSSMNFYIGHTDGYRGDFNGLIDEFRVSKGIARRTSTFASPVAPY